MASPEIHFLKAEAHAMGYGGRRYGKVGGIQDGCQPIHRPVLLLRFDRFGRAAAADVPTMPEIADFTIDGTVRHT